MKKDFLFIREFNLYHIIVDEKLGNTLCGYIPQRSQSRYANLLCTDFDQLYNLLQASSTSKQDILPELAEKLFTEKERPIIIDAEHLTSAPFISLHLGLCLRQRSQNEMEALGEMSSFSIRHFYSLPQMPHKIEQVNSPADEDLLEIARRFHDFQIVLACGCPTADAKKYFDLEDDVLFSLGKKSFDRFYNPDDPVNQRREGLSFS